MMSKNRGSFVTIMCCCTVGFLYVPVASVNATTEEVEQDNAALLYYQAFLLCPEPEDIPREVGAVFHAESGGDAGKYKKYVKDYLQVVQLVEAASKIPRCNWAIPYLQRGQVRSRIMSRTRSLVLIIGANVRILAADGDYMVALSHSLMLRRVARQIAEDPGMAYAVPLTVERTAFLCMHLVLDVMPLDERILRFMRQQFLVEPRVFESLPAMIENDFEQMSAALRENPRDTFSNLRQKLAEKETNEAQKRKIIALSDDEVLKLIQNAYAKFLDSVLQTVDSKMSYEQKHGRLEKLVKAYQEQAENNPAWILPVQVQAEAIPDLYYSYTAQTALYNVYKAAVETYLIRARTGRLPAVVPDGLPKDPFTGKNFEYTATEEGFEFTHMARDNKQGVKEYRFKVRE